LRRSAWGEVQPIVLYEGHCVLVELEQHIVVVFLNHYVAHNVSNVIKK
jgi:hypothetical protein